jgi:hypothetical protein
MKKPKIIKESRSKFISPDKQKICIYKGSTLLAEFPNDAWGREEFNLYLYGINEMEGGGVWDCDLEQNVNFLNWHSCQVKLDILSRTQALNKDTTNDQ